jgi:hypothetical protein
MAKSDPDAQRRSSLSDCTWLEKMSLDPELLRFLMHFREPGSSLYFIFINSYLFSFLIHIFLYLFFLYTLFSFFVLLSPFFYLPPLSSKLHCTYLHPHA